METYRVSCEKNTENKYSSVRTTNIIANKLVLVSDYCTYRKKNSQFIKNEEASRLLTKLGIKSQFSNIPLIVHILF